MIHSVRPSMFVLLIAASVFAVAERGLAADGKLESLEEQAFREAAALVEPSIVRIETVGGLDKVDEVLLGTGPTTGVILSEDGYLISSSFNFLSKPASILVTFPDSRRFPAKVIANDKQRMLTLLKIDATGLKPAVAVPRESIQVGQWSLALGRTYDNQTPSVSVGIVSAVNRVWGKAIQTDAKISPVNYGGPLIDVNGKVLGISVPLSPQESSSTAGVEWYDSGIGFAIPLADVYAVLDRMKAGKDLLPGLLGVTFKGNDFSGSREVIVDRVRFNSPAQIGGVKSGDRINKVDGESIARIADFRHILGRKYAGDTLKIDLVRDKQPVSAEVTLVDVLHPWEAPFLGVLPSRIPAESGCAIRHLYEKSPASTAGLQVKDVIFKVDTTPTNSPKELYDAISRLAPKDAVTIHYRRGEQEKSAEVTLGTVPESVPAELAAEFLESPQPKPAELKTGRFTVEMKSHEHGYWTYVPDDYSPDRSYGLMVFVHPPEDTMEATVSTAWKTICARRGIILLAPKAEKLAGWTPHETEFVKDAVKEIRDKYTIDPRRIVLHSHGPGAGFGCHVAFKHPEVFRGVAMSGSPIGGAIPSHEPDERFQFYMLASSQDPQLKRIKDAQTALQKQKFSAIVREFNGPAKYPATEHLEELGRWLDSLDRI